VDESLNEQFRLWLGRIAVEWAIEKKDVPTYLGTGEIADRIKCYPAFGKAVTQHPIDMAAVEEAGKACWTLGERFDAIRFGEFASNADSTEAVTQLATDFPADDTAAAERIDAFLEKCELLGYQNRKTKNLNASSAGLLASTILTAVYPKRFVDFRQTRWKELAHELNYRLFTVDKPTYGQMIVAAGRFAQDICATEIFQELWPDSEPLWTIAGISWHANSNAGAERPKGVEPYFYEEDYDEGAMELRSHLIRERNYSVVKKAKELWRATDPLLHCDVCGFSFVEAYGEHGKGYIEAHHKKPVATLKAGSKTRVSDLAKVCANCHRMIHVGNQCLELEELRIKLER
jgi:hypothetical protein